MALFWILFAIGIVLKPAIGEDTKLLLVQTVFRHGARAPFELYKNDPNPADYWKEGLGKLSLLGRKQHYGLGTFLREMYKDFITSNPMEVTVNSSDSDRCMRSALSIAASFYKPSPEWKFHDTVNWQPIPVHTLPREVDKYLSPKAECPRAVNENNAAGAEKELYLQALHREMMSNLTLLTGQSMDLALSLCLLQDALVIQRIHGLTIPAWAEYYWDDLVSVYDEAMQAISSPTTLVRLRIGPLLERIVEDMVKKSAGEIPDIKVKLYSTHDYQVAVLLQALKVYNGIRPPFCASVVFELREKMDGEKVVRLLYLNSTTPENVVQTPHVLTLDGCSEYCPLEYFVNYTKYAIPENWEEECRVDYKPAMAVPKEITAVIERISDS